MVVLLSVTGPKGRPAIRLWVRGSSPGGRGASGLAPKGVRLRRDRLFRNPQPLYG